MQVNILYEGDTVTATAGSHVFCGNNISQACRWVDAVCYGHQLTDCIFGGGSCGYPIEACNRCPQHPMNKVVTGGG